MLSGLKRLDIELHSQCNRSCEWCPNKEYKRDFYTELPEDDYLKLLKDLKDNNFQDAIVAFHLFNEPMLNIELLKKRVLQAKEILPPSVKLIANTNGDFLSKENIKGLFLDILYVNDYDGESIENIMQRVRECNITIKSIYYGYKISAFSEDIPSIIYRVKWPMTSGMKGLEDRGGFFKPEDKIYFKGVELRWRNKHKERIIPCPSPSTYIAIGYNGNIYPCGHFNVLDPDQQIHLMGNINNESLSQVYHSEKFADFRKLLASDNYNNYPEMCKFCQKYCKK